MTTMKRRGFVLVLGAAGAGVALRGCDAMPASAVRPWQDPVAGEADARLRALSRATLAPNPHNLQRDPSVTTDLDPPRTQRTQRTRRTRRTPRTRSSPMLFGESTMFVRKTYLVVSATSLIAACSTTMTAPHAGFLGDYAALTYDADSARGTLRASVPIDPAKVTVAEVVWRSSATDGLSDEDRSRMQASLQQGLREQIAALPAAPEGRAALVRAAITRVETVSVPFNAIATVLLIGPLDRGGAAVEIEAIEPDSRRQLAAMTLGYFAPLSDIKARFNKTAPAEIALTKAATEFAPLLQSRIGGIATAPQAASTLEATR